MGRVPRYLLPNGLMNLSRWRRRCLWQEEEKSANLLISKTCSLIAGFPSYPILVTDERRSNQLKWLTPGVAPARLRVVGNARYGWMRRWPPRPSNRHCTPRSGVPYERF
jgi:hypothetical protein